MGGRNPLGIIIIQVAHKMHSRCAMMSHHGHCNHHNGFASLGLVRGVDPKDICFPFEHEVDLRLIELRDPHIVTATEVVGPPTGLHRSQILRQAKTPPKENFP
ncbi:hypothetical protein AVEN_239019-1 [Araneus ventricosus]|uniref:Uncharacterized protein n=1 Tax=Araneus ventricosus TaxID=182803 RepID=A0A4Y2X667_ARAVE|nr:hypothetical protein AVEN_239019-1 [Araneus ventricosus]